MTAVSECFHLTLTAAGRPVMHGYWPDRAVAEGKFTTWIGAYGNLPAARVVLVDEQEHRVLASWPDDTDRLPD